MPTSTRQARGYRPAAVLGLILAASGCTTSPAASPTPDPVTALEATLRDHGVTAAFQSEQPMGYLGPPGRIYDLGGTDTLEVHVYPDAAEAAAAAAGVSADGQTVTDPAGDKVAMVWMGTSHFYRQGPLLAIYVGTTPATLAALEAALGPPFAGGAGSNN